MGRRSKGKPGVGVLGQWQRIHFAYGSPGLELQYWRKTATITVNKKNRFNLIQL